MLNVHFLINLNTKKLALPCCQNKTSFSLNNEYLSAVFGQYKVLMEIYFKVEFNMYIVMEFCKEVKNSVWFAHRFLCSLMRFHSRVSVCRNITFVYQPAIACSNLTTETLEQGMK